MKKMVYSLIAVPLLCLNMDKPLSVKDNKTIAATLPNQKKGTSATISLIKNGARLTPEEFRQLVTSKDVFLWDAYGLMIFTSTKLKKSETQKKEPASLVSQATRAAAQLPTKQIPLDFPQKVLMLDILLQQEKPDLDRIAEWFREYITQDKPSTDYILKIWNKALEQLSVAQSKELIKKLTKGWFKGSEAKYLSLGTNLIDALVEYQCSLRTELIKVVNKKELLRNITRLFDDYINVNFAPNTEMESKKKTILSLIESSESCKKYCQKELVKLLDI